MKTKVFHQEKHANSVLSCYGVNFFLRHRVRLFAGNLFAPLTRTLEIPGNIILRQSRLFIEINVNKYISPSCFQ